MSAENNLEVNIGLDSATAVITETREIEISLFDSDGELRLWEDPAGWDGYLREETDDEIRYYRVSSKENVFVGNIYDICQPIPWGPS